MMGEIRAHARGTVTAAGQAGADAASAALEIALADEPAADHRPAPTVDRHDNREIDGG